jgi:transmembrane sensor
MNDSLDHEDPIEEAAAVWLALRAEGFSSAQKREFARWCRADPRHAATVARLEATCALLEKMPLVRAELQPVIAFPVAARAGRPMTASRRTLSPLRVALGLAAAITVAFLTVMQFPTAPDSAAQVFTTSTGGYERVALADGSVIELNAQTKVRVILTPTNRRVELVAGEAHFTVAHDRARPFIVSAGGVAVRAVGTAFNVRLAPTAVEVLVTEGKVSVAEVERVVPNALSAPVSTTYVAANERTLVHLPSLTNPAQSAPAVEKITPATVRDALSWQERKLAFSETPLSEVVAQFNRRNRVQLILGDTALAERPVSGTFAADNVEGFVRLLESGNTITVERQGETNVILRTKR